MELPFIPQRYMEVDGDELDQKYIINTIRQPLDGHDAYPDYPWKRVVKLTVEARYLVDKRTHQREARHVLTVYPKPPYTSRSKPQPYAIELDSSGKFYGIATVSGKEAGFTPLDEFTSKIIDQLIFKSLELGPFNP